MVLMLKACLILQLCATMYAVHYCPYNVQAHGSSKIILTILSWQDWCCHYMSTASMIDFSEQTSPAFLYLLKDLRKLKQVSWKGNNFSGCQIESLMFSKNTKDHYSKWLMQFQLLDWQILQNPSVTLYKRMYSQNIIPLIYSTLGNVYTWFMLDRSLVVVEDKHQLCKWIPSGLIMCKLIFCGYPENLTWIQPCGPI